MITKTFYFDGVGTSGSSSGVVAAVGLIVLSSDTAVGLLELSSVTAVGRVVVGQTGGLVGSTFFGPD